MAEPLLDLGDVGVVEQGVGAGGGAARMGAHPLEELQRQPTRRFTTVVRLRLLTAALR